VCNTRAALCVRTRLTRPPLFLSARGAARARCVLRVQERYVIIKQIGKGSYGAALLARLKIDRRALRALSLCPARPCWP
jgi:hypothetical protein